MEKKEQLRQQIYEIEDTIRKAPQDTPNKVVFDWYTQIDSLRSELEELEKASPQVTADESNLTGISNADVEEQATESGRDDLINQWNEEIDKPQTWSQIVGTAKEPY